MTTIRSKQIGVLQAQLAQANAALAQQQAWSTRLSSTSATRRSQAPVDGTVGVRTLRVGQYVQAGTQLMAVVPLQAAYVVANYKETPL